MANCIITCLLELGNKPKEYQRIGDITRPFFERYAEKCGCDFHTITTKKYMADDNWLNNTFEKIQAFDYLETYDRVLFIDIDCYIAEDCINLFDLVPMDSFGITVKPPENIKPSNLVAKTAWETATGIRWFPGNSGVFMLNQACKPIANDVTETIKNISPQGGQSFIASMPQYYDIPYYDLRQTRTEHQINYFVNLRILPEVKNTGIIHTMGTKESKIGRLNALANRFERGGNPNA